jgi:hypothetical protein
MALALKQCWWVYFEDFTVHFSVPPRKGFADEHELGTDFGLEALGAATLARRCPEGNECRSVSAIQTTGREREYCSTIRMSLI